MFILSDSFSVQSISFTGNWVFWHFVRYVFFAVRRRFWVIFGSGKLGYCLKHSLKRDNTSLSETGTSLEQG